MNADVYFIAVDHGYLIGEGIFNRRRGNDAVVAFAVGFCGGVFGIKIRQKTDAAVAQADETDFQVIQLFAKGQREQAGFPVGMFALGVGAGQVFDFDDRDFDL